MKATTKKERKPTNKLSEFKVVRNTTTIVESLGLSYDRGGELAATIMKYRSNGKISEMGELLGTIIADGHVKDIQEFAYLCYFAGAVQSLQNSAAFRHGKRPE